ncbi:MAG: hypothetical protein JSR58_00780 [Verrucomicrobia bacterium]|nr:hypothetical protein [Verrucomicrobiota bacterium]
MSEAAGTLSWTNYVQIAFNAKPVSKNDWDKLDPFCKISSIFVRDCKKYSYDNRVLDYSKLVTSMHRWYLLNSYHISPAFAKFAHLAAGLSVVASFTGAVWKFGPVTTWETETTTSGKSTEKSWPHKIFEVCDWSSSLLSTGESLVNFTVLPANFRGVFQGINAPISAYTNLYSGPYNSYFNERNRADSTYYWMGVALAVSYVFLTFAAISPYVVSTAFVTTLFWAKMHVMATLSAGLFALGRHFYQEIYYPNNRPPTSHVIG